MISKFSLAALSLLLHTMQELAVIQILKKQNWYFSPTIFAEVISPVRNHYFSRHNNNPVPKGDLRFWPLNVHGKPKKQKEERNMLFIWWWVAHASQPFFCPQVQGWWRYIYTFVIAWSLFFYFQIMWDIFFQLLMVCDDMVAG